jgi:hypothetical protein
MGSGEGLWEGPTGESRTLLGQGQGQEAIAGGRWSWLVREAGSCKAGSLHRPRSTRVKNEEVWAAL